MLQEVKKKKKIKHTKKMQRSEVTVVPIHVHHWQGWVHSSWLSAEHTDLSLSENCKHEYKFILYNEYSHENQGRQRQNNRHNLFMRRQVYTSQWRPNKVNASNIQGISETRVVLRNPAHIPYSR